MKKYNIILADPPWMFNRPVGKGLAKDKYNTMGLVSISDLNVENLAASDAVLFLWCPDSLAADGAHSSLIRAWGFLPKTKAFVWNKLTATGKDTVGLGSYTRMQTESCWLGIRGRLERKSKAVRQIIRAKIREHSRKPDEIYSRIENLYGDIPRVELFARQRRVGWDQAYSNEVNKFLPGADK